MRYQDVVLHPNKDIFGKQELVEKFPPVSEGIDLAEDIWLGRIDGAAANLIMDTCDPKIIGMSPPTRQFAQLYCVVRELPENSDLYRWDQDNLLSSTVGLSR